MVSAPAGSSSTPTTAEAIMTCPTCNLPLTPGAYCDGNGSHPLRRARRLTGEEKRAAQREAEARREAERTRAALIEVARPVVESAQQRRYLHRRGELAAELAEAVKVGLITGEEAARLEVETAAEVAAMDAERVRKRAEYKATRQIPAGLVAPFRFDGHGYIYDANNEMAADDRRRDGEGWCARGVGRISYLPDADAQMTAWVVWVADAVGTDDIEGEEVARRMNVKAGWVGEERARGEVFSGSGVGPQADWRWITDGAYCYSGQPGEYPAKAGQIVRGVRPVLGEAERLDPAEPRRRTSHRSAIATVALVGALMGVGGMAGEKP